MDSNILIEETVKRKKRGTQIHTHTSKSRIKMEVNLHPCAVSFCFSLK